MLKLSFEEIQSRARSEWEAFCGKTRILVGAATCGRSAGALDVLDAINEELTKHNIDAVVTQVGCIGLCYIEPIISIAKPNEPYIFYASVTPELAQQIIEDYLLKGNPRPDLALGTVGDKGVKGIPKLFDLAMLKPQVRIVLRNCGFIDPININHYIVNDGYSGLIKALGMRPEDVIEEVRKSGLRGRGGAGFPTGVKWGFCRKAPGKEKYLVCNADEGDPGAFMDRSVLEGDPHAILEGILIGAYAIGATKGYIYCRAEYPLALERLYIALDQMREYGLLGNHILGTDFSFDIEIKEGAGAFVCGEETALIASIEGKRGIPRSRPPFPANSGIWGKPTNINNVETWADVSVILQRGAEWFAGYGTKNSKGTKTFSLAGKVKHTGLIEVPLGITLHQVIYDIGGGIAGDKRLKAVQTGGPSGGFIPSELLETPVDYESLTRLGSIMGSGGMVVADEDNCIVDMARFFLTFTQSESCGKCAPCRVGTRQMLDILERICRGEGEEGDIEKLQHLAETVRDSSLCALGGTAPNPVLTSIRYFLNEYKAHIQDKSCPAVACKELISYYIQPDKCAGCMICLRNCPVEAIKGDKRMVHIIDQEKCIKCGTCLDFCPPRFSAVAKVSGALPALPEELIPIKKQDHI
jgi:NADH-quinone oxidoreductase subunit F